MRQFNFTTPLTTDNNLASRELTIWCSDLKDRVNNVTPITNSISAVGDLNIDSVNIYFANSRWPLEIGNEGDVLYRSTTLEMSWVDPVSLNLEPETGRIETFFGSTAPSGWVLFNGGTIGNGSSGGTCRANADTEDLFIYLYNLFNNTIAPVSGGRGSSASEDYALNKTITLTNIAAILLASYSSTKTHMSKEGDREYFLTENQVPGHEHVLWLQEFSFNPAISGALALRYITTGDATVTSSNYTTATKSYSTNFKYEGSGSGETFEEFSVAQPSVNVNMIIKL